MNGWSRVPNTRSARIRVEDYLRNLGYPRTPYVRLLRLARLMELRVEEPDVLGEVYRALTLLDPELADSVNEVRAIMTARKKTREQTPPQVTHRLLGDGSLEQIEGAHRYG